MVENEYSPANIGFVRKSKKRTVAPIQGPNIFCRSMVTKYTSNQLSCVILDP